MGATPHTAPGHRVTAFNCPHCRAFAEQRWSSLFTVQKTTLNNYETAQCSHCGDWSIWHRHRLVYPQVSAAPAPNADLPQELRDDYQEASDIMGRSPRGAAALLRQPGRNLNDDIAAIVRAGANPVIQRALDIVRITGNAAVHPGEIDLTEDVGTAARLCMLINLIAENLLTAPRQIDDMFNTLPQAQRDAISRRDGVGGRGGR